MRRARAWGREIGNGAGFVKANPNAAITLVDLPQPESCHSSPVVIPTPFPPFSFFPSGQCKGVTKASPIYSKWRNCEIKFRPGREEKVQRERERERERERGREGGGRDNCENNKNRL